MPDLGLFLDLHHEAHHPSFNTCAAVCHFCPGQIKNKSLSREDPPDSAASHSPLSGAHGAKKYKYIEAGWNSNGSVLSCSMSS